MFGFYRKHWTDLCAKDRFDSYTEVNLLRNKGKEE